jgi:predicted DNA-binding transcriptional regulator AlpA
MALTSEDKRTRQTVTQDEVLRMLGVSRITLSRWIRAGKFPKPLPTLRKKIWNCRVVEEFLNSKG